MGNLNIPSSVISIGNGAFAYTDFNSISVATDNAIYDSRNNCNAIIKTSSNQLIVGCTKTQIPTSITAIGDYAFAGNENLSQVVFPNNLKSIGHYAFRNCNGITEIDFPSSLSSIGEYAFYGCTGLSKLSIPSNVTSIGTSAFGNNRLTSIVVDEKNTTFDSRNNSNSIIEKSSNTLIQGCKNTIIPSSITSIGSGAFHGCTELTNIAIPNSVQSIGAYAFLRCEGLSNIELPNSLQTIGFQAFDQCKFTKVVIPTSVKSIANFAFYNTPLRNVTSLNTAPPSIESSTFGFTTKYTGNLVVPTGYLEDYKTADGWKDFKNIQEAEQQQIEYTLGTVTYAINQDAMSATIKHVSGSRSDLVIPESISYLGKTYTVTSIGEYNQEIKGETNVEIIPVSA